MALEFRYPSDIRETILKTRRRRRQCIAAFLLALAAFSWWDGSTQLHWICFFGFVGMACIGEYSLAHVGSVTLRLRSDGIVVDDNRILKQVDEAGNVVAEVHLDH